LSESQWLNDSGQVVGQEDTVFPFLWTPTVPNGTVDTSIRLPLPPAGGSEEGSATSINANGDVVGFANALDPFGNVVQRAVLWGAGSGAFQDLGTLMRSGAGPFLGNSHAFGINNAGTIVGVSDTFTGTRHAFVFDPILQIMRDLGSLVPLIMLPGTSDPSRAIAINSLGDIVGEARAIDANGTLVTRAFLLPAGSLFMQDLGTLLPDPANPGAFLGNSSASGINDVGTIVGDSDAGIPAAPSTAPALFQAGAPVLVVPAVGTAETVNQSNVVVGSLGFPATSAYRFHSTFGLQDLTAMVATLGTTIQRAVAINASGQIAAIADSGAGTEAVLLTP